MKQLFLTLLTAGFALSVNAASFKTLPTENLRSQELADIASIVLLEAGEIEDVGVEAIQITARSKTQTWDKVVRQYTHMQQYIDEVTGSIVKVSAKKAGEKAGDLTNSFISNLRQSEDLNTESLAQDLQENLEAALKNKNLIVVEGSAAGPFSSHYVLSIVDSRTMEMIQLSSGYAE